VFKKLIFPYFQHSHIIKSLTLIFSFSNFKIISLMYFFVDYSSLFKGSHRFKKDFFLQIQTFLLSSLSSLFDNNKHFFQSIHLIVSINFFTFLDETTYFLHIIFTFVDRFYDWLRNPLFEKKSEFKPIFNMDGFPGPDELKLQ